MLTRGRACEFSGCVARRRRSVGRVRALGPFIVGPLCWVLVCLCSGVCVSVCSSFLGFDPLIKILDGKKKELLIPLSEMKASSKKELRIRNVNHIILN